MSGKEQHSGRYWPLLVLPILLLLGYLAVVMLASHPGTLSVVLAHLIINGG